MITNRDIDAGSPAADGALEVWTTPEEALAPGIVVGRFIVHRALGAGATGMVYAAHDPELDRTIALKVLRRELAEQRDARTRFLREAQALARVSHPSVIAVYDVGAAGGRTFIAMEYIHGQTFADWVASSQPSWSEIVAMLVKAGRGLAAAHAAGLIHRDFKPANLLVGADGRAVVTDFGLARAVAEPDAPGGDTGSISRSSAFADSITRTGAVQGTPAYMAPEQRQGVPADARADQFSFCVTLHEALYRGHPFLRERSAGTPPPSSSAPTGAHQTMTTQHPAAASRGPATSGDRSVPAWLQRAVQRGLSVRPEDRFPSMEDLLGALNRAPRRRRRIQVALAGAAVAMVGGALAIGLAAGGDAEPSCTGARAQLARIWNDDAGAQLRAAFAATGRPHAPWSADRIGERLDAYTGRWVELHRATCLATVRGEQSSDLLDRRMVCLERRRAQLEALLDLFIRRASGELVDGAIAMVADLEPVATCADSAALLSRVPPPANLVRRALVTELERQVDRADLERRAGRPQTAIDIAQAAAEAERALDYPPLAARAARILGRSLDDQGRPSKAREALVRAEQLAERGGDLRGAAEVMLDLVAVIGLHEQHSEQAHLLGEQAQATLEHPELRADPALRARLLEELGTLANQDRQGDRAVELLRAALAIRQGTQPPPLEDIATAELRLANAMSNMAPSDAARAHYLEALALRRRLFGDAHPLTADVHGDLGGMYHKQGDTTGARAEYLAALAILQRDPTYRNYPLVLNNLGALERTAGDYDRARGYLEEALAVRERQSGPDHPEVARTLHNLGNLLLDMGEPAKAIAVHRRVLAIREKTLGKDHPSYATTLSSVGEDLRQSGHAAESLDYQDRAIEVFRARLGDHAILGFPLAYRALALIELGRRREAIPLLEQALTKLPPGDPDRARAAFGLARALEPRRPRSQRARRLAQEALDIFVAVHATHERENVAAYLAG